MDDARKIPLKCLFAAWIFAWVTAIYLPSALIATTGLSPLAEGRGLLAGTFAVADEVSPAAKIGFALLFVGLAFAARRLAAPRAAAAVALDMLAGALAILAMLALLPADWSRGFGIGLSGSRFAPVPTAIYLTSALLSGLVFAFSAGRCARRAAGASAG